MRKFILMIFISVGLTSVAFAGKFKSVAQTSVEILDGLCVKNSADFNNIKHMMAAMEGKELSKELKDGDPVLRNKSGSAYAVNHDGRKFIVAYVNKGGCTIVLDKIESLKVERLIKKHYSARLIHVEDSGMQISKLYKTDKPSIYYSSALFSIVYGKPETGIKAGSIGFIPKAK